MAKPWARAAAAAVGAVYVVLGGWAFLAPGSFYRSIAAFPPDNAHFMRDVGAFQLGLGLAAVACALSSTGHRYVMAGIAAGTALHVVAHLVDIDEGGNPVRDITSLVVLAALAAAAAAGMPGRPGRSPADPSGP